MKLTNEMILRVLRSMPNRPWGIGSTRGDALAFARAILKEAGVEELERDAERYRWLCNQTYGCDPEPFRLLDDFDSDKESISIAIDKAMKAK